MATYSPLSNVSISLATASFSRAGFGIPLFVTPHRYSKARVIAVTKESYLTELPSGSPAYAAAATAFAQPNGLSQLLIGRVEANVTLTLANPTEGDTYALTLETTNDFKIDVSVTAPATPTRENVVDLLVAAINGDSNVGAHVTAAKVGTGASAVLTISPDAADDYYIISKVSSNMGESYTTTETAGAAFQAITLENGSSYFVLSSIKTAAWIKALALAVNAQDLQYWFTVSDQEVLEALTDPAATGDILGEVKQLNQDRIVGGYHQDADTTFPELAAVAYNAPFQAGRIVWGNDKTSGVAASRNTTSGNLITLTEKQNLLNRNSFFWDVQGGITFLNSDVKTMSGERPENIRGRDNMVVDIQAAVAELLINQVGKKLPYNQVGISMIVSVLDNVLQTYVQRGFIEDNYKITFPDARLIAGGIKATQKLDGITFVAQLTGAITMVDSIRGTLQLDEVLV